MFQKLCGSYGLALGMVNYVIIKTAKREFKDLNLELLVLTLVLITHFICRGKTMVYYGYKKFVEDVKQLVRISAEYEPDTLIAIARGGLTLGHAYASATDNRQLMCINSILYEGDQKGKVCEIFNVPELGKSKKVLILDDIVDSGQTVKNVLNYLKNNFPEVEFKIASIYYKKTAVIQPDFALYETNDWIEFFWEKDYLLD